MRIALIDIDGHNFPNLPLMKLSAYHRQQGDTVEWYEPLLHSMGEPFDKAYMSKVFSFTPDYPYYVNGKEVIKGGSGYCITLVDGKEVYDAVKDSNLPPEIETIYPDYSIYYDKIPEVKNTAYGFLTRGCPRGCEFCHVGCKEGKRSYKVADLDTFWRGQKNIVLLDPNITACKDWEDLFHQLIGSRAYIDFSQGLDIRMMTEKKAEMLKQMKIKNIHFAWDRLEDKSLVLPKFEMIKEITGLRHDKLTVYMLVNFNTTTKEDLERVYTLRDLGFSPFVMIYNKDDFLICDKRGKPIKIKPETELLKKYTRGQIEHFNVCWRLQRWVNNRIIFGSCQRFEEFDRSRRNEKRRN